jgi:hypothetical protein
LRSAKQIFIDFPRVGNAVDMNFLSERRNVFFCVGPTTASMARTNGERCGKEEHL